MPREPPRSSLPAAQSPPVNSRHRPSHLPGSNQQFPRPPVLAPSPPFQLASWHILLPYPPKTEHSQRAPSGRQIPASRSLEFAARPDIPAPPQPPRWSKPPPETPHPPPFAR